MQFAYLIHMLAKHATPMNASNTVRGLPPANASTRVISRRSIALLLNALAMVKPPMRSMIVGENICEKTYLQQCKTSKVDEKKTTTNFVASVVESRFGSSPPERITRKRTSNSGTQRLVTNRGIACVQHEYMTCCSKKSQPQSPT
jgi:hypothetical protein